jgi:hypothetical protein
VLPPVLEVSLQGPILQPKSLGGAIPSDNEQATNEMRAAQKSSIATAMKSISKLFVAIAVAATAMAELRAGSAFLGEEATPASGPRNKGLTHRKARKT